MRKLVFALAATAVLAAGPAAVARDKLTPQQRLDKMLAGREAGKPVSCISQIDQRDMVVLDKTALVYGSGSVIYVNKPRNADDLDDNDVLVTRQYGSQLCSTDIVNTYERVGWFPTGFISLSEFVPYRKVKTEDGAKPAANGA